MWIYQWTLQFTDVPPSVPYAGYYYQWSSMIDMSRNYSFSILFPNQTREAHRNSSCGMLRVVHAPAPSPYVTSTWGKHAHCSNQKETERNWKNQTWHIHGYKALISFCHCKGSHTTSRARLAGLAPPKIIVISLYNDPRVFCFPIVRNHNGFSQIFLQHWHKRIAEIGRPATIINDRHIKVSKKKIKVMSIYRAILPSCLYVCWFT